MQKNQIIKVVDESRDSIVFTVHKKKKKTERIKKRNQTG
jgi:hypothetical protein